MHSWSENLKILIPGGDFAARSGKENIGICHSFPNRLASDKYGFGASQMCCTPETLSRTHKTDLGKIDRRSPCILQGVRSVYKELTTGRAGFLLELEVRSDAPEK